MRVFGSWMCFYNSQYWLVESFRMCPVSRHVLCCSEAKVATESTHKAFCSPWDAPQVGNKDVGVEGLLPFASPFLKPCVVKHCEGFMVTECKTGRMMSKYSQLWDEVENIGPVFCWSTLSLVWGKTHEYGGHKFQKIRPCMCKEYTLLDHLLCIHQKQHLSLQAVLQQ